MKTSKYNIYFNKGIYNIKSQKVILLSKKDLNIVKNGNRLNECSRYDLLESNGFVVNQQDENYWDYLRMRRINNRHFEFQIMVTSKCNFKCEYCYEDDFKSSEINEKFINEFMHYLDRISDKFDVIEIEWFGGEPLLKSSLLIKLSKQIKDFCCRKHKTYVGSITTNGYLLNYDTFKKLVDSNVYFFQITLDGVKENHNVYRVLENGGGTYDKIINNLEEISKKANNLFYKISIRMNYTKINLDDYHKLVELVTKIFNGSPKVSVFKYPVRDWGGTKVTKIKNDLLDYTKPILVPDLFNDFYNNSCIARRENCFVIDGDGNMFECSHRISNDFIIGNINMDKTNTKSRKNLSSEICKDCILLPYCYYASCPLKELKPFINCKEKLQIRIIECLEAYYK